MINIATDGACKGNPGPGGWGVYMEGEDSETRLSGGAKDTTNNRMELQAFIEACKHIESFEMLKEDNIIIWLDSTYVLKGATQWLRGWRQKDYKGVKNDDLWRQVADLRHIWLKCDLQWCKGHSTNAYNKEADRLANEGVFKEDDW